MKPRSSPEPGKSPVRSSSNLVICGVDEAGRGPVIGPLVVCGVACETDVPLRQLNVRDSKKLSPERRGAVYPQIPKGCRSEGIIVSAPGIDAMRTPMTLYHLQGGL